MRRACRKTKQVLISGGLATGGPETHVKVLCRVLIAAGAKVTIAAAATNWTRESIQQIKQDGVRVIVPPFGFGLLAPIGKICCILLWPLLLRKKFDVMYCIGEGRMHLFAARFCQSAAYRIYHEIVDCPEVGSVGETVAKLMDGLIGNSVDVTNAMSVRFPDQPVKRIAFLTSSGPVDFVERTPNEVLRVAFLGRLVQHKRPLDLIESWAAFQQDFLGPSQLHFYGSDCGSGYKDKMQARIVNLKQQNNIFMHGSYHIDELPSILMKTDLVVLPSKREGLPLVLVEAMLRGVPIVATCAGGTAEFADDNPDVLISDGTEWIPFVDALAQMSRRIRAGAIDPHRLSKWAEERYGFDTVSRDWRNAILTPTTFFRSNTKG